MELKNSCIYTFSILRGLPQSLLYFVTLNPYYLIDSLLIEVSRQCSGYFRPGYQFQPENSQFHQVMSHIRSIYLSFDEYFKSLVSLEEDLLALQSHQCCFSINFYFLILQFSHYFLLSLANSLWYYFMQAFQEHFRRSASLASASLLSSLQTPLRFQSIS
jgi:hypothetical protein